MVKTRAQAIAEYADAFRKENNNIAAARILYGKLEQLFSSGRVDKEMKIRCIAEEIDHIICGYKEVRK